MLPFLNGINRILFFVALIALTFAGACQKKADVVSENKGYNEYDCGGSTAQDLAAKYTEILLEAGFRKQDIPKFVCLANDETTFGNDKRKNPPYLGTWQILPSTRSDCCPQFTNSDMWDDLKNAKCAKDILERRTERCKYQGEGAWEHVERCQPEKTMYQCFLKTVQKTLDKYDCPKASLSLPRYNENGDFQFDFVSAKNGKKCGSKIEVYIDKKNIFKRIVLDEEGKASVTIPKVELGGKIVAAKLYFNTIFIKKVMAQIPVKELVSGDGATIPGTGTQAGTSMGTGVTGRTTTTAETTQTSQTNSEVPVELPSEETSTNDSL